MEGGDNTVRSPAEAGPSTGTQLKSGVNKHIYGPADLDKEKAKAETEEALWEAGQGGLSWEALGCSSQAHQLFQKPSQLPLARGVHQQT